jgi:dethiobiotin synthetase
VSESVTQTAGLFVTATDTGVGKTYVTALIGRALRDAGRNVGAYKPACSGAEFRADGTVSWGDVEMLTAAIGGAFDSKRVCPLRFRAPLAPNVAARREGSRIDFAELCEGARWWQGRVEILLVEGVGGLLCPLTDRETIVDLAVTLNYPLLIVARLGLGTINHTLLTVEAARSRGLTVSGVLLNEPEPLASLCGTEENPVEIERLARIPVLGILRHGRLLPTRADGSAVSIDWASLARFP